MSEWGSVARVRILVGDFSSEWERLSTTIILLTIIAGLGSSRKNHTSPPFLLHVEGSPRHGRIYRADYVSGVSCGLKPIMGQIVC